MVAATDLQQITPSLWLWQAYDPAVKSDLFATAVLGPDGLSIVDPIPLARSAKSELTAAGKVAEVFVTNSNHMRAAADFAHEFAVSISCRAQVGTEFADCETIEAIAGKPVGPGINAIAIDGAAEGEMAFHFEGDGGTIVIGDALIHLDPYGFALLPAKYCSDRRAMQRSLRQLLDWSFERLLFAHGTPILSSARARLKTLLR